MGVFSAPAGVSQESSGGQQIDSENSFNSNSVTSTPSSSKLRRKEKEIENEEEEEAIQLELSNARKRVKELEEKLRIVLLEKKRKKGTCGNENENEFEIDSEVMRTGGLEEEARLDEGETGELSGEAQAAAACSSNSSFEFVFSSQCEDDEEDDGIEKPACSNPAAETETEIDSKRQIEEEEEDDEDVAEDMETSPSPSKSQEPPSPFEFVFSSPGGGGGGGGERTNHVTTEQPSGRSHQTSSNKRDDKEKDEQVFDFVFCSPQQGKIGSNDDEKENSGNDSAFLAKQKQARRKSNVESFGETLSQRLAESLSGLFIDMPTSMDALNQSPLKDSPHQRDVLFERGSNNFESQQQQATSTSTPSFEKSNDSSQQELDLAQKFKAQGNRDFVRGDFGRAIEGYTSCINTCLLVTMQSFKLDDSGASAAGDVAYESAIKIQADALSNRAASHIMLDNSPCALEDCEQALKIVPGHERAQVRYATCKLYMCDFEEAKALFRGCKEKKMKGKGLHADVIDKLSVVEAILDLINITAKAFPMNKSNAEEVVASTSRHLEYLPKSRELVYAKCNVLLSLHKYSEVLQILSKLKDKCLLPKSRAGTYCSDSRLKWLHALACSGMGELEKAVRLGEACFSSAGEEGDGHDSIVSRIGKWKKLLDLKREANTSYENKENKRSQELYTEAIKLAVSPNVVECPPFTAILYCNRGATYQNEGNVLSALSDCARACSLCGTYVKAFTRASSICEGVQLYQLSSQFLREVIDNCKEKGIRLVKKDYKSICQQISRFSSMLGDNYDTADVLPDYYGILSLDSGAQVSQIKKAYHKVALRCHPDKDPLCGHVSMEKMNLVFTLIRQAYDVLSDESSRLEYDEERASQQYKQQNYYYGGGSYHDTYNHGSYYHSQQQQHYHHSSNKNFRNNWRRNKKKNNGGNGGSGGNGNFNNNWNRNRK